MGRELYYKIYIDTYRGQKRVTSLKNLGKTVEEIENEILETVGPVRPTERGPFRKLIEDELNEETN